MRMIYKPHPYQERAIQTLIFTHNYALFIGMGMGKSSISLTAFTILQQDFAVDNALIIAPKKVAESTWDAESTKWEHTKHLRVSKILGSQAERIRALNTPADLYVINRENVKWLVDHIGKKANPFDMLIIDELSSFKSPSSQRFKALKKLAFKRVVGLTGTPASNGEMDLWSEIYLLDKGERLGKTITSYRANFFSAGWGNGNIVYKYNLRPGAAQEIQRRISDICMSMKAEDYLDLPARMDITNYVALPDALMKQYKTLEKEMVLTEEITALNAASLAGKLIQFANGAIYKEDKTWQHIHDAKLEALDEIIEATDNVLIAYSFKHDLARLKERYPEARTLDTDKDLKDWNAGKIKILLAHPASAGHGLNLQAGGSTIVWFGLNWSLELYQQFNARLHRQGQTKPVFIHHLITKGTFDEKIMEALKRKDVCQENILQALKEVKK